MLTPVHWRLIAIDRPVLYQFIQLLSKAMNETHGVTGSNSMEGMGHNFDLKCQNMM